MTTRKVTIRKCIEIPRSDRSRYINAIPLPIRLKSEVVAHFDKWILHNGHHYAVSRMKCFREFLMEQAANPLDRVKHPPWFKTRNGNALTGTFGWLLKMSRHPKHLRACLDLTGIYTSVRYAMVDSSDREGNLQSIVAEGPDEPMLHTLKPKTLQKMLTRFSWRIPRLYLKQALPLDTVPPGKQSHAQVIPETVFDLSRLYQFFSEEHQKLLSEAIGGSIPKPNMFGCPGMWDIEAGFIHATMEPGLKTRYFANPNKVFQRALEPLKDGLFSILKEMPWDCTLNQRKADKRITQALQEEKTVYSVDLSSATDRFPYWFQKICLQALIPEGSSTHWRLTASLSFLDLLVEKGEWELPGHWRAWVWKVGQPLGLGPSFPLFTISHGLLLLFLNKGKWKKSFYVVGDDVIIFDKSLYLAYKKILTSWQVPVSERKTFSSKHLAQFAGVTYTPHGNFWLPKWRELTRETLVDVAAFWYERFTKGLKHDDRLLIEKVLALPAPWGIGRNPDGIPLSERLTDQLISKLLEIEMDRLNTPKACATRRFTAYDNGNKFIYLWKQMYIPLRSSRPHLFSPTLDPLMDQTEVSGYPRVQVHRKYKSSLYTLGRTQYWKNFFDQLEHCESFTGDATPDPS
nr:TPA_asm: RdRp [Gigantidas vrijenhoeki associated mitovirus 1]